MLPFYLREKGHKHPGLASLRPSDSRFVRLISYRSYRLMDTEGRWTSRATTVVHFHLKRLELSFADNKFSGDDPVMIFNFLTRFVEEAEILGISEGQEFLTLPSFITKHSLRQYRASKRGARSGGITCWPEAIQHFLRTFVNPSAIRDAIIALLGVTQLSNEEELDFSTRLNDTVTRFGNVHAESEKMTFFVDGLLPTTRPIVARLRESTHRDELTL